MHILLIEDDADVAAYISKGLNEAGHTVNLAHDGKRGLGLSTTEDYDVMIIDRMLPGISGEREFDPFDRISDLPQHAPGLAARTGGDTLAPLAAELRIPAAAEAGLRSQGIDPAGADAATIVLGIMRLSGAVVTPRDADTHEVLAAGKRTMVRVVPHRPGEHPELDESSVRRFAADFATSGTDQAMLITEKYAPFEVYDRERRNPRARYITRERVQDLVDALSIG